MAHQNSPHYVIGDSSPFLKRILVPFWCIRIFVMGVQVVVLGLTLAIIAGFRDDVEKELHDEYGTDVSLGAAIGVLVVNLLIILACLILDLVSIIKRGRRTLSPRFFLIANTFQTLVWTVLFALTFVGPTNGLGIAISIVIYLSFVGMLIYAAVIFHKQRKGTLTYAPAGQADPSHHQGFNPHGSYGYGGGVHPQQGGYYNHPNNKQGEYEMPTQYGYGQQQQPQQQPPQYS